MAKHTSTGVFCIEGAWEPSLRDRSSVLPLFELLETQGEASYVRRDAMTKEELQSCVKKWPQRQYDPFPVLFLAFHGEPRMVRLGKDTLHLDELGELLEGQCRNRISHFESCQVLDIPFGEIEAFRAQTGAKVVTGYAEQVGWIDSAAFTLNYISALSGTRNPVKALEGLEKDQRGTSQRLGFRAAWRGGGIGLRRRSGKH